MNQSPFPQQPSTTPPSQGSTQQNGKGSLMIILLAIIILLAGGIASVAGYLIISGKGLPFEIDFSTTENTTPTPLTPTPVSSTENTGDSLQGIIQTALSVKNYSLLIDSLSPIVTLTIEASECCGQVSIAETINQLSYLNESTTWVFNSSDETIQSIKANNPQTYQEMTVGISDNKYVFGYKTNTDGKITDIRIASSYDILIPATVEDPPEGATLPTRSPSPTPTTTPSPQITPEETE